MNGNSVAVSPNGKRLAFVEKLAPERFGMFVSNLDGSNRKLLSNGDPYAVTVPVWSPDGNWIIASLLDPFQERGPVLTLIQVDTCQIIPLPDLSGYVSSWLP
jgi:Tol biopolymer transport system component